MDRTLQSSYSEMMGLFPPSKKENIKPLSEKQLPGLKIRSKNEPKTDLTEEFLATYNQVPVYSYLSRNTVYDDITPGGCNYSYTFNNDHWNKEATYTAYSETILSVLREPVGKALGLS